MTVYVEFVIISNFFIDLFLCALTAMSLKAPLRLSRLIVAAGIGAIAAAIYPIIGNYRYVLKLACVIILPAIIMKHKKFKSYITATSVFIGFTIALGGAVELMLTLVPGMSYNTLSYGIFPIVTSCGGLIIMLLSYVIKKEAKLVGHGNALIYDTVISNDNAELKCRAFYDSGNRVYTKNGERVVIVNEGIYNKLMPAEEETVSVRTASGEREISVVDATLEIYFKDGVNKIYNVKAGKSSFTDAQIILHSDMLGEYL